MTRNYKTGRMVKCSDPKCHRHARVQPPGPYEWHCGEAPYIPKAGRVGQQKQKKRKES